MSSKAEPTASRVDALMQKASAALVARRYFEAEVEASEALRVAFGTLDYERMSRIVLPLQEARRLKRQLALDTGKVFSVNGELPVEGQVEAGCYLVSPPRVGLDGRLLRELADRSEVPIIVVVREPTTRDDRWPLVALGPVTIRTKVKPPEGDDLQKPAKRTAKKGAKKAKNGAAGEAPAPSEAPVPGRAAATEPLPAPRWFVWACEQIGDAAIAGAEGSRSPDAKVEELYMRLQAHPDHEKLHQRLREACEAAAREGLSAKARAKVKLFEDEEDEDGDDEGEDE